MSRERKLIKNTVLLSIGTFLPKLAEVIILPVLTTCLTKEEYGTYDLITVSVSLFLPVVTLQIQTAAFRFLIDIRDDEHEVKSVISSIIAFILPVSLLALFALYYVLPQGSRMTKVLICAYYFVDICSNNSRQIARGLERNLDYSVSAVIGALGKLLFAVVFVWYFRIGLKGAVLALLAASTISFIALSVRIHLFRYIDCKLIRLVTIKKLLQYSWPMVPNNLSMWVMRLSDRFVVTMFMGVSANAVYAVANKIPSVLALAHSTFNMAWQENASLVVKDKDADTYYSSMFRRMIDLVAGLLGLLMCAAPLLFRILIRGDYSEAYVQLPILFLSMFFYSMSTFLGGIYVAFKATKSVGVTTTVAAVCNLVIDLALIRNIGLFAASGSTLISYLLLFIFRMVDVKKIVSIQYDFKHLLFILGILLMEATLCFSSRPVFVIINAILGLGAFFVLNQILLYTIWKKIKKILRKDTKC